MSIIKQKRLKQKQAAILEEAKKVLTKHGNNATMGDIAKALNMDKSSLYYYFKGIPEILNTILDQEYYDFSVDIHRLRKENRGHLSILKEVVKLILEFYHDNIEILAIILSRISPLFWDQEVQDESKAINDYMESYLLANRIMLEEIQAAVKVKELETPLSSKMILQTLRGAIFGVCSAWKDEKSPREQIPLIADRLLCMYK